MEWRVEENPPYESAYISTIAASAGNVPLSMVMADYLVLTSN
jgi:hypothetical protein